MKGKFPYQLAVSILLVCMFGLAVGSSLEKSPTFDEAFYFVRGWAFLKTFNLMPLGHPPLTNLLSGSALFLEPNLPDPTVLDGWISQNAEKVSEDLLWNRGLNTGRILLLVRMPNIFLSLLLGALVSRWTADLYGRKAAVLVLLLYAFSPNILAHARLATTEMGVTLCFVAALYTWANFLKKRTSGWLLASGLMVGLAQASKFSAGIIVPVIVMMLFWKVLRHGSITIREKNLIGRILATVQNWPGARLWTSGIVLGVIGVIATLTLWGSYLFIWRPYPLSAYIAEVQQFLGLASGGHFSYYRGMLSPDGWWFYHPIAFLIKTPLATLTVLSAAILLTALEKPRNEEWNLLFPAFFYVGISMFTSLNVGVRYILPVIPLLLIFSGRVLRHTSIIPTQLQAVLAGSTAVVVIATNMLIYPHYLAYFNKLAGGPENGAEWLVDSNLDWGQDLPGLAQYVEAHDIDQIYLSYFGQAFPSYYDINYLPLPGWPPPSVPMSYYHPMNPPPGLYAISASNLVGVQMYEKDALVYFMAHDPIEQIGYSINIYEVNIADTVTAQEQAYVVQCYDPPPVENDERLKELTGIDNLNSVYIDCQQSLFFADAPTWIMLPAQLDPIIALGNPDYLGRNLDGSLKQQTWLFKAAPPAPQATIQHPPVELPLTLDNTVELLGYEVDSKSIQPGDTLTLTNWWQVKLPSASPVSFYAHMSGPDGATVSVADGLGVPFEIWQPGMVIVQQHTFDIPADAVPGAYTLTTGLYSLETGERFALDASGYGSDQIEISTIEVR